MSGLIRLNRKIIVGDWAEIISSFIPHGTVGFCARIESGLTYFNFNIADQGVNFNKDEWSTTTYYIIDKESLLLAIESTSDSYEYHHIVEYNIKFVKSNFKFRVCDINGVVI